MKFWMMLAIALVSLCTVSCGSDDDDEGGSKENPISASDPEGTVIANLTNTFHPTGNGYYADGIDLFGDIQSRSVFLGMNSSNNLQAESRWGSNPNIVSIGKVSGLASIKNIPETGWSNQTAVIPGYGYVYRWSQSNQKYYARIYVVDYMTSTTGGIMGATIKYQDNWKNTKSNRWL